MNRFLGLYCANKNAWIISEICKKWLMSWDVKLTMKIEENTTGT
jgi:hypothetical protein